MVEVLTTKSSLLRGMTYTMDSSSILLLLYLADKADEQRKSQVSLSEMADALNMYSPNISKKLNKLEREGIIKIEKTIDESTNMMVNVYTLPKGLKEFRGWLQ